MNDTENKLRDMLVELHGFDRDKVTTHATFDEDLGADSLDMREIVMDAEELFGVDLPDNAGGSRTVGDLVVVIDKALGAK